MKALNKLLVKSAIILNYPAKDAEDVVSALGDRLLEAGYVKGSFVQAALTREQSMPTGLPLGGETNAAIPHTDIEHVIKSGVAMATLTKPVTFHNMANPEDTVEVKLVFLLALDQPKAQIEMLQEIAGVLQSPDLIKTLMNAKTPEEVIKALEE
jgi:PTS system galactitol-specific IIA component